MPGASEGRKRETFHEMLTQLREKDHEQNSDEDVLRGQKWSQQKRWASDSPHNPSIKR
jgi:hypothetical protein